MKPGDDINARGTSISPELLSKLLVKNVLAPAGGRRFNFAHAKFTGDAYFTHVAFTGDADFSGAEFVGFADFQYATFAGRANFYGTQFNGSTAFVDVKFNGQANLSTSKFTGDVSFVNAIFAGDADFSGARFTDRVGDSRDVGSVSFVNAVFAGDANFTGAHFNRGANFCKASFHRRCMIGPVHADLLRLASATFDEKSEVHCDGLEINADDIRALRGMTMSARGGDISISAAVFGGPTTIAPSPIDMEENELWPTLLETRRLRGPGETRPPALAAPPPKLLTVAGADVTNLTVSGLDLSRCKFLGASNLDRLRIDGAPRFAETPAGRGWIRRLTIAEEHEWRARYDRRPQGWSGAEHRQSGSESRSRVPQLHSTEARYLEAARIQVVYRELRKGREDARDEPGAADFYYGEMEMRRLAIPGLTRRPLAGLRRRLGERILLNTYWVVSGYGLRAGRALVALTLLLALATVGFDTVGFTRDTATVYVQTAAAPGGPAIYRQTTVPTDKPGLADAAVYSIESASSLLSNIAPEPLTSLGRIFEIALRLLGPLLLGLAILAVRGRVKR